MGFFDKMQEVSFNVAEDEKIRKGEEETRNSLARKFGTSAFYGQVGNHDFAIDHDHRIFSATYEKNMQSYIVVEDVSHITGYSLEPAYKDTSLGNSIVGGILFGGAGAIVGAITSKDVESATKCWLNISTDFSDFQTRQYLISTSIGQNIVRELDRLCLLGISVKCILKDYEYKKVLDKLIKEGKEKYRNNSAKAFGINAYYGDVGDAFFSIDIENRLWSATYSKDREDNIIVGPFDAINGACVLTAEKGKMFERCWTLIDRSDKLIESLIHEDEILDNECLFRLSADNFGTRQILISTTKAKAIIAELETYSEGKAKASKKINDHSQPGSPKERLTELKELLDLKLISETEYNIKRQEILDAI